MLKNYFTFGFDHTCPETGESLAGKFVEIEAPNAQICRVLMFAFYDNKWAFQYSSYSNVANLICYEKISVNRNK